jgi:hypothetical protein
MMQGRATILSPFALTSATSLVHPNPILAAEPIPVSIGQIPSQERLTKKNAHEDLDIEAEDNSEEEEDDED